MKKNLEKIKLFAGSSHPLFAKDLSAHLGLELGGVKIEEFPDKEISLQILETVRGFDVFIIQTIAINPNYYLMELLIMVDAIRRASAKSIGVILPYYGYCRQDRKDKPRVPITAKLVANLLVNSGVDRVMTMDLHTPQLEGFFDIPVDNLYGKEEMAKAIQEYQLEDLVVVTPDIGSIKLTRGYADLLNAGFAIVDKKREDATHVKVISMIGDVKGKDILLADDMCSTASTLLSAALACQERGAKRIFAAVTHGLFVGEAIAKIEESPIEKIFISNTIPTEKKLCSKKVQTVSVANLFAQAIRSIVERRSISSLYTFHGDEE